MSCDLIGKQMIRAAIHEDEPQRRLTAEIAEDAENAVSGSGVRQSAFERAMARTS